MRKVTSRQTAAATWAADSTISTDIEQVGLITRIDATVEITPSATLTAANQPDGIFRLVQNLRIAGGGRTYFNLPADAGCQGGTLLHYLNALDGFGVGHGNAAVAAPTETYTWLNWVLHCGTRPRDMYGRDNPFDVSAFIPASQESQLVAEWVTSGNDVMDDTVTISSAVMRYTIHRLADVSDWQVQEEMFRLAVVVPDGATGMVPAWSATVDSQTGTAGDFSHEVNVQLGGYLKRIAMLFQDATASRTLRSSDEVTEIALLMPDSNEKLIQVNLEVPNSRLGIGTVLMADSGAAVNAAVATPIGPDFNGHAPEGIAILDLRPHAISEVGREYGLDMRGLRAGAVKLGFTISNYAAGDDSLILWERYLPWEGLLVDRS